MKGGLLNFAAAFLGLISLAGCITAGPPRADRDWYPYLARTAHVEVDDTRFSVTPVTDWSYRQSGPTHQTYTTASHRIDALRGVWFVIEPDPKLRIAAHTFLLFEFDHNELLGLTIEARREANEDYSPLAGVFNQYELSYLWGSARDLLTRRAVMLQHMVRVFPVNISDDQNRTLLTNLLERTQALETHPRYYNTLFSNCTNELAKAAGFNWAPAFILTGESDEYLLHRHLISGENLEAARASADVTQEIVRLNALPAGRFDAAMLTELRHRRDALTAAH